MVAAAEFKLLDHKLINKKEDKLMNEQNKTSLKQTIVPKLSAH